MADQAVTSGKLSWPSVLRNPPDRKVTGLVSNDENLPWRTLAKRSQAGEETPPDIAPPGGGEKRRPKKKAPGKSQGHPHHDAPRTGILAWWHSKQAYGFIVDGDGLMWFVYRGGQPELEGMPEGTPVTFRGSHVPETGRRFPQATHVQADVREAPGQDAP
jgi:hypothetical protein